MAQNPAVWVLPNRQIQMERRPAWVRQAAESPRSESEEAPLPEKGPAIPRWYDAVRPLEEGSEAEPSQPEGAQAIHSYDAVRPLDAESVEEPPHPEEGPVIPRWYDSVRPLEEGSEAEPSQPEGARAIQSYDDVRSLEARLAEPEQEEG